MLGRGSVRTLTLVDFLKEEIRDANGPSARDLGRIRLIRLRTGLIEFRARDQDRRKMNTRHLRGTKAVGCVGRIRCLCLFRTEFEREVLDE